MIEHDFDRWNEKKKQIELSNHMLFPREGEVWMCVMGKNIGIEQNGSITDFVRPILVVKKFNNQMFWVVPLSGKQKRLDFYYNFTDPQRMDVSAILAQLRMMSTKRFMRKMYTLAANHYIRIRESLGAFLVIETPP